jgi:hypothetical protein
MERTVTPNNFATSRFVYVGWSVIWRSARTSSRRGYFGAWGDDIM